MITLQGKGVFGGIAIGEIAFFKRDSGVVQRKKVEDPQTEIQRTLVCQLVWQLIYLLMKL